MATLLTIEKLNKSYHQQALFKDADLAIHSKQKIGVIGCNGAGKSTLFRMLVDQEKPDSGIIAIQPITRLGYLEQHQQINPDETVLQFLERTTDKENWQCAKLAGKFEIKNELLHAKLSALSGGYQMRVRLSSMLLREPNLFLLDEPTNYLDVHTQLLLEKFLRDYSDSFLIISHDREFLKRTCEQTLEIEQGNLTLFPRPIDEYLEYKEEHLAFAKLYNKKIEREQRHLQNFVNRFRYKASKASQAQSKLKAIEKLKKLDIQSPLTNVRIHIPNVETKKGLIFRCEKLVIGYPDKTIAENITLDVDRSEHVAILGDNGQGKTTFLKTLASELSAIGGKFKWAVDTTFAYYAQHVPNALDSEQKVWNHLRTTAPSDINDEEILRMAGNFLFHENDLEKYIHMLSGGEKARLCLASILLSKNKVLLLDEPTNHLDFETVEALGLALQEFNGTVLFISHNRTFVNSIATMIIEVKNGEVRRYPGNYEEYIYNLEQSLEPEKKEEPVVVEKNDEEKRQRYEEIKAEKKKLKKIEDDIFEMEKTKTKLLRKQTKDPKKFSLDDYRHLGDIDQEIKNKENEWLTLQEKIEK
ncbi:MAG: ABC-F family ATP-binding cassette domain-containing protein [Candidatus Magasanikbacteria bacterium]|nr:ABC-F family ATP-binding cassette domain-containing protein [Candidatus Magasanikbacteria bacterium]